MHSFFSQLSTPFKKASYKVIFPKLARKQVIQIALLFSAFQVILFYISVATIVPSLVSKARTDIKNELVSATNSLDFTYVNVKDGQLTTDLKDQPKVFTLKETEKQVTLFVIDITANSSKNFAGLEEKYKEKSLPAVALFSDKVLIQTSADAKEYKTYTELFGANDIDLSKQQIIERIKDNTDISILKSALFQPLPLLLIGLGGFLFSAIYLLYKFINLILLSFAMSLIVFSFLPPGPQRRPLSLVKLSIFAYMGWSTIMLFARILISLFPFFGQFYNFLNILIVPEIFMWFVFSAVYVKPLPKEKKKKV